MVINGEFLEFLSSYFWITAVRFYCGQMFNSQRFKIFQEVTVAFHRNPNYQILSRYARSVWNSNMFVSCQREATMDILAQPCGKWGVNCTPAPPDKNESQLVFSFDYCDFPEFITNHFL